ncbi:MAG: hypothetical protein LBC02_05585, partial [Planctomycetaceae bacterium]|nr:hypothetical protein [Planctomycetaceae bacterium]
MVDTASYERDFEHGTMNGKLGWLEREIEEFYYTSESTIDNGDWLLQSGDGYFVQETSYGDFANGELTVTNSDDSETKYTESWKQLTGTNNRTDYIVEDNEWIIDDESETIVDLLEYLYDETNNQN